MKYGSLYYGKRGFVYKKTGGGGARRIFSIGAITNTPQNVFTNYVHGSGVGASSKFANRAKMHRAIICSAATPCGQFLPQLGLYSRYNGNPNGYVPLPIPYTSS